MNCAEVSVQTDDLLDGATDPARERLIESHLAECPSCSARLEQMRTVRALLKKSTVPPPSSSLDSRVMRAFHERRAPTRAVSAWWRRLIFGTVGVPKPALALPLVAVCVALLVGVRVGRMSGTQIVMPPLPPLASTTVPAPPSQVNVEPAPTQRIAPQRAAISRNESRPSEPRKASGEMPAPAAKTKSLESFTVVSPSGASYSTRAALAGFEPITGTRARVIKGEER
jgi:anti-sigma factor RsiW